MGKGSHQDKEGPLGVQGEEQEDKGEPLEAQQRLEKVVIQEIMIRRSTETMISGDDEENDG